jgi:hypothetical protein
VQRSASQARAYRIRALCSIVVAVIVVACRTDLTQPNGGRDRPTGAQTPLHDDESPASVTVSIPLDPATGGGTLDSTTVYAAKYPTWVKVLATGGTVTFTSNFPVLGLTSPQTITQGDNTVLNYTDASHDFYSVRFGTNPQYIYLNGGASRIGGGGRSGLTPFSYHGTLSGTRVDCGPPPSNASLCGTFTGDAGSFTITRLASSLNLTADSASASPGSTVPIRALASPSTVDGLSIPVVVDSSRWVPDPDSLGGDPSDTGYTCSFNPCNKEMFGPGTMHVIAYVNGARQEDSVHIRSPGLSVIALPARVHAGDTVTFTPRWSDGALPSVNGWTWTADSGTTHPPSCGSGNNPCKGPIQESGSMSVGVYRNGLLRYAKVHVAVGPTIAIDATPNYIYAGELVTFAVSSPDGSVDVTSWRWSADAKILANRRPLTPGRFSTASIPVPARETQAERNRLLPGSPLYSVSNSSFCVAHSAACTDTVIVSGMMHVTAVVSGVTIEDSAHVQVADLDNLPPPPPGTVIPDGVEDVGATPGWCLTDYKSYLNSNVFRNRLKILYDSQATVHVEFGSFGFVDSSTSAISVGPIIRGTASDVPGMNPPPPTACMSMHTHPPDPAVNYQPPSGNDLLYAYKWSLAGYLVTKDYVFIMDANNHVVFIFRRTG